MNTKKIVGIALIVIGGLILTYRQLTVTTSETLVDVGPLEVREQDEQTIPLPPLLGGLALAIGAGLLLVPSKR